MTNLEKEAIDYARVESSSIVDPFSKQGFIDGALYVLDLFKVNSRHSGDSLWVEEIETELNNSNNA